MTPRQATGATATGTTSLGVDLANPNQALALYESCGFRAVSAATAYRKPLPTAATSQAQEVPR